MIDDQNTPNVTNSHLPSQNKLGGMILDDRDYKLLGKMGKLFRNIVEEDKPIKSLELVESLSVEGVNLDSKVLYVLGFLKGIDIRAAMSKLYVTTRLFINTTGQKFLDQIERSYLC